MATESRHSMEIMSTADAAFLYAETPTAPMHVGTAAIFEGPPPAFDEVVAMLERKLPLLPRYRQRVRFVPNDLGRPVWVDYPHFDLAFHVRRTAVPSPGGDEELKELGARVLSQALDREQAAVGAVDGRGARRRPLGAAVKTHHCMVDGVSGTRCCRPSSTTTRRRAEPWAPGREPTDRSSSRRRSRHASSPSPSRSPPGAADGGPTPRRR